MGLFRLTADKVAYIFGVRVTKRLRVKLSRVLEKRQRALSSACRLPYPNGLKRLHLTVAASLPLAFATVALARRCPGYRWFSIQVPN